MTEQELDYQDYDDTDLDVIPDPGIITPGERVPFSREDLINAHQLRTTDYISYLEEFIDQAFFTPGAKRQLKSLVNNYLSRVAVLSNFQSRNSEEARSTYDELKSIKLQLQIELGLATCNMFAPDNNGDLITIQESLFSHFSMLISRARGRDRERTLQGKTTTEHVQKAYTVAESRTQQPKKLTLRGR